MNNRNELDKSTDKAKELSSIKMSLITAAISATLRLAIPMLGLFFIGLAFDIMQNQTAFWSIIGAIVGFAIAAYLVYLQIKKIQKDEAARLAAKKNQSKAGVSAEVSSARKNSAVDLAGSESKSKSKSAKSNSTNSTKNSQNNSTNSTNSASNSKDNSGKRPATKPAKQSAKSAKPKSSKVNSARSKSSNSKPSSREKSS